MTCIICIFFLSPLLVSAFFHACRVDGSSWCDARSLCSLNQSDVSFCWSPECWLAETLNNFSIYCFTTDGFLGTEEEDANSSCRLCSHDVKRRLKNTRFISFFENTAQHKMHRIQIKEFTSLLFFLHGTFSTCKDKCLMNNAAYFPLKSMGHAKIHKQLCHVNIAEQDRLQSFKYLHVLLIYLKSKQYNNRYALAL